MAILEVKPVAKNKLDLLREISITTFKETFGNQNKKKDIQIYLKNRMNLKQLEKELNNPDSKFYFAYSKNILIGYLKLNFELSQSENVLDGTGYEIERIYILKKYQGIGHGNNLFQKAIEIGKMRGYKKLWLGVWEQNKRALDFYKKHGLNCFNKHTFLLGTDQQTDFLLKLEF